MKRSLALLLASLLVVFGLTACGNDKKQDQGNQDSAVVGDDTVGNNGSTANDGLTGNNATDNGDKNNTNKDESKRCDFMTWDMPVATKCEKCGSTLFRKGSKLYCAKEGCDFEMPVPKKD